MIEQNDPWFTCVEIEVNTRCNRRCSYCPVSVLPVPQGENFMEESLFDRILSELERIGFCGNICYHLYNEPLLRRDLECLVSKTRDRLPDAWQMLFTNGDLLSDERYSSLKQAGVNHFVVTRHDSTPIPQRLLQTVLFPADLVLVNRGGFFRPLSEPLEMPCYAPTDKLTIAVDGSVLLCCNDAQRSHIVGNIASQNLEQIWFSPDFVWVRRQLQLGNRKGASAICSRCDDLEYFAPGENNHIGERRQ